ncbi:hypothetical protein CLV54_3378 [Compostimonas suwonensis]|uniref:Uncharacterized protein n=1 Tax=Compostimonas suwonensis TaxID=1048394 RepID=A0A2M9BBB6_9MICO|nr:hypothetical protein CLV54_3378 [Compostimonas suwonensis]
MRGGSWVMLAVMVLITAFLAFAYASGGPVLLYAVIGFWAVIVVGSVIRGVRGYRRSSARNSVAAPAVPVVNAASTVQDMYLGRTYSGPVVYGVNADVVATQIDNRADWLKDGRVVIEYDDIRAQSKRD